MSFPWLLILGVVVAGWSFLSVLGNERQRKIQDRDAGKPPKTPETPVGR